MPPGARWRAVRARQRAQRVGQDVGGDQVVRAAGAQPRVAVALARQRADAVPDAVPGRIGARHRDRDRIVVGGEHPRRPQLRRGDRENPGAAAEIEHPPQAAAPRPGGRAPADSPGWSRARPSRRPGRRRAGSAACPPAAAPATWLPWTQKRPIGCAGKLSAVRASQSVAATGATVRSIRPRPERSASGARRAPAPARSGSASMQQLDLPERARSASLLERARR